MSFFQEGQNYDPKSIHELDRKYPHRAMRRGCAVQIFVGHEKAMNTLISSTHVPVGTRRTVGVRLVFQHLESQFICVSRKVSSTSEFRKIHEIYMSVVELLNNVHNEAIVDYCDSR